MRKMKKVLSFSFCAVFVLSMFFGNTVPVFSANDKVTSEITSSEMAEYELASMESTINSEETNEPALTTKTQPVATGSAITVSSPEPETDSTLLPISKPETNSKVYFYVLKRGFIQPSEIEPHAKSNYSLGRPGELYEKVQISNDDQQVLKNLKSIPAFDDLLFEDEHIKWYVVKYDVDGWHVDGIIENQYTVKVNYLYENETTASESKVVYVEPGESYSIVSPTIIGYLPNDAEVEGTADKATFKGIEVTVIYKAVPDNTPGPTTGPTTEPTTGPTTEPTTGPTSVPTTAPTSVPSSSPTQAPIVINNPSVPTTQVATPAPTATPTAAPTIVPSPTQDPTEEPEEIILDENDTPKAGYQDGASTDGKEGAISQATAKLPQTGTTPIEFFYIAGFLLIGSGLVVLFTKRNHKKVE
jgi:LPXTG-motif cell wall-anchored protein